MTQHAAESSEQVAKVRPTAAFTIELSYEIVRFPGAQI